MSDAGEVELVAMLVLPSEYVQHINEVAGLTTTELIVIERKFASRAGFELVKRPISGCTSIAYFDERSVVTLVSGVFLTALVLFILGMLALNWNDLSGSTRLPVAALAFTALYGVRRMFGARRHRLVFTMENQKEISWSSRAGEFLDWTSSVENIRVFARSRALLRSS